MSRIAIIVSGDGTPVFGTPLRVVTGRTEKLKLLVGDRVANGEAFEGEHVIRLPRRFSRSSRIALNVLFDLSVNKWPEAR